MVYNNHHITSMTSSHHLISCRHCDSVRKCRHCHNICGPPLRGICRALPNERWRAMWGPKGKRKVVLSKRHQNQQWNHSLFIDRPFPCTHSSRGHSATRAAAAAIWPAPSRRRGNRPEAKRPESSWRRKRRGNRRRRPGASRMCGDSDPEPWR